MEKDGSNLPMRLLYGNPVGRFTVKAMLVLKVPKVMAWYLHTLFKGDDPPLYPEVQYQYEGVSACGIPKLLGFF